VVTVGESVLCCCRSWCGFYFVFCILLMFGFCGNGEGECVYVCGWKLWLGIYSYL
jgi:hypothetical protein